MTIDRIDWHLEAIPEDIPEEERLERAGAHIGYYLEWAYKNGFAPSNPETHDVEEYQKVTNSEKTGIQFLIENCDTKFWDVDLNEEGQKFTSFAYNTYLQNIAMILRDEPYAEKYNQTDFQSVSRYLDNLYTEYLTASSAPASKKKQTLFQKIKSMLKGAE